MMNTSYPADLKQEALRSFRIIFGAVRQHFQQLERSCGINGAQVWALKCICAQEGLRVTELAQALAIHQSTASNLIAALSARGLIRRERLHADQRVVVLQPTAEGRRLMERVPGPPEGLLPAVLSELEEHELRVLLRGLAAVIARFDSIERGSPDIPLGAMRHPPQ